MRDHFYLKEIAVFRHIAPIKFVICLLQIFSTNWRAQRGKFLTASSDFYWATLCVDKIRFQPHAILCVDKTTSSDREILCVDKIQNLAPVVQNFLSEMRWINRPQAVHKSTGRRAEISPVLPSRRTLEGCLPSPLPVLAKRVLRPQGKNLLGKNWICISKHLIKILWNLLENYECCCDF